MSNKPLDAVRILVVEDQYYVATDICEWLEDAGAKVIGPAPDVVRAKALLAETNVDSAVVDINLGRGPTFEIASELTERKVPFLFATGYDSKSIPPEFQHKQRLEKPFAANKLVSAMLELQAR